MQWLDSTTNHGEFVVVPDLSKMSLRVAKEMTEKETLRIEVSDSAEYNPNVPRYAVISQEPKAGEHVKEHRKVYVRINPSGYRKVTLPQLKQLTKRNAQAMLKAIGLEIGEVEYVDDIGKDMVLGALHKGDTIYAGDKFQKTSVIDLICGNGIDPDAPKFGEPVIDSLQQVKIDSINTINAGE
ncbi:hypothetical protein NBRC110019_11390 [Neptunitalea chrysea]|uniref:PASTA domain-containing protein n=1 Tax=Neptunitalea chrysea TaxID=1647581 RepID=A0A9W6ETJ9_9FLAO|nr:hypothetical protein NBRC110019_11390 [Neptunitalea chrysea]